MTPQDMLQFFIVISAAVLCSAALAAARRSSRKHKAALRSLRCTQERLRILFDQSPAGVLVFDGELMVTECNERLTEILGVRREELVGAPLAAVRSAGLIESCRAGLCGEVSRYEGSFRVHGGQEIWLQCVVSPQRGAHDVTGGVCVALDVTAAKQAEALIERLAFYDALTGLPNRSTFRDRLRVALDEAEASGDLLAVALLDIDRFKTVNEALGQGEADRLLQRLVERLERMIPEGCTLARVGGDDLALMMPRAAGARQAMRTCEAMLAAVRTPWDVGESTFSVTASLGLALYPNDGREALTLLKNAERAQRRARDAGGDRAQFYDMSMDLEAAERLAIEHDLRVAMSEDQLIVYYEPQVSLEDGRVRGVEALVRWEHPARGMLTPAEFVPVAEESGLVGKIGEWVLRTACRELVAQDAVTGGDLRLSVNLSPRDLQSSGLVQSIGDVLHETGLAPGRLQIELTETAVISDLMSGVSVLQDLRGLGIGVVLDDFGTGYASLSHLRTLPINGVKLDRSFVSRCRSDPDAASIVAAMVGLAHSLQLGVVAEGVETAEQVAFLKGLGCGEAQGYLFGKPAPITAHHAFAPKDRFLVV